MEVRIHISVRKIYHFLKPIFDRLSPAAVRVSHRTAKFVCTGTVSILTADTTVGAPLAVRRGPKNRVRHCYSWEKTLSKTTLTITVDVFGRRASKRARKRISNPNLKTRLWKKTSLRKFRRHSRNGDRREVGQARDVSTTKSTLSQVIISITV